MKKKTKKLISKILKRTWYSFGILLFAWTLFWFVRVRILNDYAFIINVILFAIGLYALIVYVIVTIVFLLIKEIVKNGKPKNNRSRKNRIRNKKKH